MRIPGERGVPCSPRGKHPLDSSMPCPLAFVRPKTQTSNTAADTLRLEPFFNLSLG